jgi:hypothetical protein
VLDYYPCKKYLHKVAKGYYGTSVQAVEWVEATLTRLDLGKMNRMQAHSEEAAKAIATC